MPTQKIVEYVALYYKQGSSDKEYTIQIEQTKTGFSVDGFNCRRGGTPKSQPKGVYPTLVEAKRVYDDLLQQKRAKGYQIDTAKSNTASAPLSNPTVNSLKQKSNFGYFPHLLIAIDDRDELQKYLENDDWALEVKEDGERRMVRIEQTVSPSGNIVYEVSGGNRMGLDCPLPKNLATELAGLKTECVLDGEIIDDMFYAFDMLESNGTDMTGSSCENRYDTLAMLLSGTYNNIELVEMYVGTTAKTAAAAALEANGVEGLVFKKLNAPYIAGKNPGKATQIKFKFWETASCIVSTNTRAKRSVGLQLYEDGKIIDVGNVTIPPNKPLPQDGDIVDIKYLYAYPGGSLYQPQYLHIRTDIPKSDCMTSQLKYKK